MRPEPGSRKNLWGRLAVALIGAWLLTHLVRRAGPATILHGIASVGWGLLLVIALAGLALAVRTWAWRLTLVDADLPPSFGRMFALRLVSEAAGQIGVFGQVFGDAWRIARLGSDLPIDSRIASVALDRALYTLSSTMVTIAGVTSAAFLLPLPGKWALYAKIFASALIIAVVLAVVAARWRWPAISGVAKALRRLGRLGQWVEQRREAIQAVEDRLFDFFHHSPAAFRWSFSLQMASHVAAVFEVFLVLRLMGQTVGLCSALAIEGLTKLVNVVGMINPGNAGTYEGGNMLFARLVSISGTAGLTLALIRRIRALFWAAIGAICAVLVPGSARQEKQTADTPEHRHTAVILAHSVPASSLLARVGELPVLLRAILGAHKAGARRIVVIVDPGAAVLLQDELRRTRRLPTTVEWCVAKSGEIAPVLCDVADGEERIVVIAADRTYHPALHRRVAEWSGGKVLALTTHGAAVGISASGTREAADLLKRCPGGVRTIERLHVWLTAVGGIDFESAAPDQWQRVSSAGDRLEAEHKLDQWLVKSTDGVFARMNRRVSIPISRVLIKFPITPNMVSYFTLGVGFLAGAFFARGGREYMLIGSVLSVFASILDGCDGEVARLTFQDSAFGCWLETICDHLYYILIFAGMMIGLLGRGPVYWIWGTALFFGAIATLVTTGLQRRRMAGASPEQYLSRWQAQASKRSSNPFLYLGRHTEFLIRRCCMPYLILAFAVFGATYMAFIGAAVGANIAWPIALYSYISFNPARTSHE